MTVQLSNQFHEASGFCASHLTDVKSSLWIDEMNLAGFSVSSVTFLLNV